MREATEHQKIVYMYLSMFTIVYNLYQSYYQCLLMNAEFMTFYLRKNLSKTDFRYQKF